MLKNYAMEQEKEFRNNFITLQIELDNLEIGHEPVSLENASQSLSNELRAPLIELTEPLLWIDNTDLLKLLYEEDFHLLCELNSEFDFLSI